MSYTRAIEAAALAIIGSVAALLFLRPIWDIDIFWHIAAGRWMWVHGTIPDHDIFGLDPERTWISFQWGYQVLAYLVDQAGGLRLLRAVHAAVMGLAFLLLYRTYRRQLGPLKGIALLLLTLMLFQDRINVRPHVFNLLGLAILLPALLGGWRDASRATIVGWALWCGVWANLHAGGCLIMLVVMLAIPVGVAMTPGRPQLRRAVAVWAVCALPCLVSPHFVRGNLHALTLVQTTQGVIGEWSVPLAYLFELDDPGASRIVAGLAPYITLLLLAFLAITRRLRGFRPTRLGLLLAFTGLSLLYVRFVHFCAPAWLILMEPMVTLRKPHRPQWGGLAVVAGCLVAATAWALWSTNIERLFGGLEPAIAAARTDIDERRFPVEAADFLDAMAFEGTIFCHARYGGYLLWRLHPQVRTLIDGRLNVPEATANDIHFVHTQHRTQHTDVDAAHRVAAIFRRYGTDALVVEAPAFAPSTADCSIWLPVYRSGKLEIYLRNDAGNGDNLTRLGLSAGSTLGCSTSEREGH